MEIKINLSNFVKNNIKTISIVVGAIVLASFLTTATTLGIKNYNLNKSINSIEKENKALKKSIAELNIMYNDTIQAAHRYKEISDSLQGIQKGVHDQTTKIIYVTKKQVDDVRNIRNYDELQREFTNSAEEYWNGYLTNQDSSKAFNGWYYGIKGSEGP